MNLAQRVRSILAAVLLLGLALLLFFIPQEGYFLISLLITLILLFYGFKKIWYYFTMSRHMVGGKATLYQAILLLDLGLLTGSLSSLPGVVIVLYLLGFFAVSGVLDVLRALEQKFHGAVDWKPRLFLGLASIVFSVAIIVFGVIRSSTPFLVTGFCVSLVAVAVARLIRAFRKTSIIFIQ